ncbi:hypothetical protein Nmel_006495, partial [Mimus melanotis]
QQSGSQLHSPGSNHKIWTWSEVAEELLDYSRKYGPVKDPEEKMEKTKGVRHIVSPSDKQEKAPNRQYWWALGMKKGVPRDVMHGLPFEKLVKIVSNWHCHKPIVPNSSNVQPSAPSPPLIPGTQITALTTKTAQKCGIVPTRKQCFVLNALGTTEAMDIAFVKILLPGEEKQILIKTVIGDIPNDLLGMDVLAGRQWEDEEG